MATEESPRRRHLLIQQLQASPYATNTDFVHVQRGILERHWKETMDVVASLLNPIITSSSTDSDNKQQQQKQQEWLNRLIEMHQQEGRHYHTAVHLEEILGYLDIIVQDEQQQPSNDRADHHVVDDEGLMLPSRTNNNHKFQPWQVAVLILTTFFHDAVYDTKSSTNEEDSAKLFQTFFQDLCGDDLFLLLLNDDDGNHDSDPKDHNSNDVCALKKLYSLVVQIILATKRHELPPNKDDDDDEHHDRNTTLFTTFLDLDMAVLGKQPPAYLAYARLIRQEYHWVPQEVFCETRANILQGFLDRTDGDDHHQATTSSSSSSTTIYLSPHFQEAWQDLAKDNLRTEIALLRQGIIPGNDDGDEASEY
jgi:predicted metal-dependent HD superfamily phosphohydrolase